MADRSVLAVVRRITSAEWPKRYPLVQFPNVPLGVALIASVVGNATDGQVHDVATAVYFVGLGAWAYEELADGVNMARRLMGVAGLLYVVATLAGELA